MGHRARGWATAAACGSVALAVGTVLAVSPAAVAAPVVGVPATVTLNYTCPFPLIGNQPVSVAWSATLPAAATVGGPVAVTGLTGRFTFPETATQGFTLVGARTVEGQAERSVAFTGTDPASVSVTEPLPSTQVPPSGPFDVVGSPVDPAPVTAREAGTTSVSLPGDTVLTLTPRTANGAETGLGTFNSTCTLQPGQATVLGTVLVAPEVLPMEPPPTTTTTTTTTAPTTTTTTAPPPSKPGKHEPGKHEPGKHEPGKHEPH